MTRPSWRATRIMSSSKVTEAASADVGTYARLSPAAPALEVCMPGLQERLSERVHEPFQVLQLAAVEPTARRGRDAAEPELGESFAGTDMDVRRLLSLVAVEKKAIRPDSQHCRNRRGNRPGAESLTRATIVAE